MQVTFSLDSIDDVAKKVLDLLDCKTVLLYGEMGSGKTTLVNAFVKALGGATDATSPTFSLVNEYQVKDGKVYHFDMYRINDIYEALDFGIEEYLNSGEWIFIEWPEKIDVLLPDLSVKLYIKLVKNGSRALDLECVNSNLDKS